MNYRREFLSKQSKNVIEFLSCVLTENVTYDNCLEKQCHLKVMGVTQHQMVTCSPLYKLLSALV